MLNNIGQAADTECRHECASGFGLHSIIGKTVMAREQYHHIGSAVERAQAQVIVQVAGVMNRDTTSGGLRGTTQDLLSKKEPLFRSVPSISTTASRVSATESPQEQSS
jgi:hypothetical protein